MNKEETSEKHLYELTPNQESSIEISRNEIRNDKFYKNEDVISEIKKWLKTIA